MVLAVDFPKLLGVQWMNLHQVHELPRRYCRRSPIGGSNGRLRYFTHEEFELISKNRMPLIDPENEIPSSEVSKEISSSYQYVYEVAEKLGIKPRLRKIPKTSAMKSACYTREEVQIILRNINPLYDPKSMVLVQDIAEKTGLRSFQVFEAAKYSEIDTFNCRLPRKGSKHGFIRPDDHDKLVEECESRNGIEIFYFISFNPRWTINHITLGRTIDMGQRFSTYRVEHPYSVVHGLWNIRRLDEHKIINSVIRKEDVVEKFTSERFLVKDYTKILTRCVNQLGEISEETVKYQ